MDERRILLAVTGGIAAYKTPELVRALKRAGHDVRCAMTRAAAEFVSPLALQTVSGHAVRRDLFDAAEEGQIDHIALADWAELVIVAPATAHSLARFATGLADDLVTTVMLATRAPLLLAPAMNVNMWRHPATAAALTTTSALANSRSTASRISSALPTSIRRTPAGVGSAEGPETSTTSAPRRAARRATA